MIENDLSAHHTDHMIETLCCEPFEKSMYWCGYPTGGNRKTGLVAIERTYSFFLRTTGTNDGLLPDTVTVNGRVCTVGE